ncbi:MAG: helix-turn-helix transcriptional regulator [Gracilimonas sp.]|uniref:helix-turn-helix domain-containing protein n=1 Tax=Gracilimonas sp. TaxID=1974203 RepID=UPI001998F037|nr:helix-turn-helix transcriptional regulator [Gracilimonas sp.]MBD3617468.1 helix-turn-helix transcriptional regulator [Gracilimonas sp.]
MAKERDIEKVLGSVIRELRLSRNLSQEKLAELGDFERSYISKVENGERAIQFKTVVRFAEAFGIKVSELAAKFEEKSHS